jgi:N-acetylneuraminic acid mutarotase
MRWLLLFLCGLYISNIQAQPWRQLQPVPFEAEGMTFAVNSKIYAIAGKKLWEFDPLQNNWTEKNFLPRVVFERTKATIFVINGKAYVGLGFNIEHSIDRYKRDLYEYDPINDTWTQRADLPGERRHSAGCFVLNDKAYVGGGSTNVAEKLHDLWEYDPSTDSWARKADIPVTELISPMAFSGSNRGYFVCGLSSPATSGGFYTINATFQYDPVADTWQVKAPFPFAPVANGVALAKGNIAFVGTGMFTKFQNNQWQHKPVSPVMYSYDMLNDKWSAMGMFPGSARFGAMAVVLNEKVYFGTGGFGLGQPSADDWWEMIHSVNVEMRGLSDSIEVYPNPANDKVHFKGIQNGVCILNDACGRTILSQTTKGSSTIDVSKLSSGSYWIRLITGDQEVHQQLHILH